MRSEVLTYKDMVTGKEVTRTFYFNLTDAELAEMNLDIDGGFEGLIKSMEENPERSHVIKVFKALLGKAVMEKTPDGKRYVKSDEISNEFLGSDAYSKMFEKLALAPDSTYALEFLSDTIMGFDKSVVEKAKADPEYIDRLRNEKLGLTGNQEIIDDVMPDA